MLISCCAVSPTVVRYSMSCFGVSSCLEMLSLCMECGLRVMTVARVLPAAAVLCGVFYGVMGGGGAVYVLFNGRGLPFETIVRCGWSAVW